jgi:hypothetical protein
MENQDMSKNKGLTTLLIVVALFVLSFFGMVLFRSARQADPSPVTSPVASTTPVSTTVWDALLEATPFPYFTPLPEPVTGEIDGIYAKVDQSWPQWWRCLRCADYRTSGGIWKLQFDRGVMRIFYEVNNWRSIASYSVSGDRLFIFNDPYCPENTGEYKWSIENGGLAMETVQDACAFNLRAENLTKQSWLSCTDAKSASATSKTEETVPGCSADQPQIPAPVTPQPPLRVTVHGGDSRFFEAPPEVIAHANAADMQPPEGISISFAEESIPYGLSRVVWWNGSWIEASSDGYYTSMGVQFMGEGMIGWARLLFDGQEVWRGNTSEIWSKSGRHGGFVEISGFEPGLHTLRVESLGFDYRPVTVAGFGFSQDGVITP